MLTKSCIRTFWTRYVLTWHIGLFVFLRLGFWVKNGIMVFCSSPISSTKRHSVMLLAMKNDQKSTLSFKSEARGHEKGQLRPKSQLATASSIFFPNENRHWVEAIPKIWWLKKVAIALFQNWPKSLHKILFFPTLKQNFYQKKLENFKTKSIF